MDNSLFDNAFSPEELEAYSHVTPNAVNVTELKKTGHVTQSSTEKDGVITDEVSYSSFDGRIKFTKTNSYLTDNKIFEHVKQLNERIKLAVDVQNYEEAIELIKEKKKILNNNTTKINGHTGTKK